MTVPFLACALETSGLDPTEGVPLELALEYVDPAFGQPASMIIDTGLDLSTLLPPDVYALHQRSGVLARQVDPRLAHWPIDQLDHTLQWFLAPLQGRRPVLVHANPPWLLTWLQVWAPGFLAGCDTRTLDLGLAHQLIGVRLGAGSGAEEKARAWAAWCRLVGGA